MYHVYLIVESTGGLYLIDSHATEQAAIDHAARLNAKPLGRGCKAVTRSTFA